MTGETNNNQHSLQTVQVDDHSFILYFTHKIAADVVNLVEKNT